jgi:hypothetical protein
MSTHKFSNGEMVIVQPDTATSNMRPGSYLIVQQLPAAGGSFQYRVRGLLDPCERIVNERWLRAGGKTTV